MYKNYGDKRFLERGMLVEAESDTVFNMIVCNPYSDEEDMYQFARVNVDIEDSWIDRKAVMQSAGMSEDDYDAVWFAISCVDYYGPENFGADSLNVTFDWMRANRELIANELKGYLIGDDVIIPGRDDW